MISALAPRLWGWINSDPFFADVAVLLDGDGASGGTTFTDLSSNGFTVTPSGNAQTNGSGQILLDGTGDYLTISTPVVLAASNFVLELTINAGTVGASDCLMSSGAAASASTDVWTLQFSGTGKLDFFCDGGGLGAPAITSVTTFSAGTSYRIRMVRSGSSLSLYVDDVLDATAAATFTHTSGGSFYIGAAWTNPADTTRHFDGTMDNLRITLGQDRAGEAITTGAFPTS